MSKKIKNVKNINNIAYVLHVFLLLTIYTYPSQGVQKNIHITISPCKSIPWANHGS